MPNYAAKSDLINTTGVDTSDFAKKADSASLKSNVDELDINKLKNVPSGSDRLKSKVDKLNVDKLKPVPLDLKKIKSCSRKRSCYKIEYNKLVKNVNVTDTNKLVQKKEL